MKAPTLRLATPWLLTMVVSSQVALAQLEAVSKITESVTGVVSRIDTDKDGVPDYMDAFPLDGLEYADADGDGIGDLADNDDNNNGVLDRDE